MSRVRKYAGAFAGFAALSSPLVAQAGPPEWLAKAVIPANDPTRVVLAYENRSGGLLFSSDGGDNFAMRCMYSLDTGKIRYRWEDGTSGAKYAVTGQGVVLVPVSNGLVEGSSAGCGFTMTNAVPGFSADALAAHPTNADVTYLYMSPSYEGGDNCTRAGLMRRDADGSYHELGEDNTVQGTNCTRALYIGNIATAALPNDGVRIYETGARANGTTVTVVIRYTENDGASFTEYPITQLPDTDTTPTILLVNPNNPAQLLLRLHKSNAADKLYISNDSGRTLTEFLAAKVSNVTNALIDNTGRVWLGDRGSTSQPDYPKGLWTAPAFGADTTYTHVSEEPIYCLAHDGTRLYGCDIYGYGPLDEETGALTETFNINDTAAYVSCDGEDVTSACDTQVCDPRAVEGWCAPLHHAIAPICDRFNSVKPCCGWPARDYDDRANRGEPIDGTCRIVAIPSDAGVADGGPVGEGDAGAGGESGGSTSDASVSPVGDASASAGDAGTTKKKKDDGCSVSMGAHDSRIPWGALVFGLFAAARGVRRRRR